MQRSLTHQPFNHDISANEGYLYTTKAPYSSVVANQRMTEEILKHIPQKKIQIIDVGCGDGTYTFELSCVLPKAHFSGFDLADRAIKQAQKKYPNIEFSVVDVLHPPKRLWNQFDIAIVRGVIHHLSDGREGILSIRHLAERVIIVEPNGNNPIVKLFEKWSPYHQQHDERSYSSQQLRAWCEEAGLHVKTLTFIGFVPFFFPTLPAKIIHVCQPVLEKIPFLAHFFGAQIVIVAQRNR